MLPYMPSPSMGLSFQIFWQNFCTQLYTLRAHHSHTPSFIYSFLYYLVKIYKLQTPHYKIFSTSCYFNCLGSNYLAWCPVL